MQNFNKKGYVFTNNLVIAELSRDTQDYKEEWLSFHLLNPYTILRVREDGLFETLDGKITYKHIEEKTDVNEVYVSGVVLLCVVTDMFYVPLKRINKLREALEGIELHEDIEVSKKRLKKIGF